MDTTAWQQPRLRVGVLGPLELHLDGEDRTPTAPQVRRVLAMLALRADRQVSLTTLIAELWEGDPPRLARKTVQTYVYQLRRALTRAPGPGGVERLQTRPSGYLMRLLPEEVDLWEFEGLVTRARAALDEGQPEQAAQDLRKALALWRGDAFADISFGPELCVRAPRIEAARITALELRVKADLQLGRHRELLDELRQLAADHPLNERFAADLMIAAQSAGQRATALDAYTRLRRALVQELGIEPSDWLRDLQREVLTAGAPRDLPRQRARVPAAPPAQAPSSGTPHRTPSRGTPVAAPTRTGPRPAIAPEAPGAIPSQEAGPHSSTASATTCPPPNVARTESRGEGPAERRSAGRSAPTPDEDHRHTALPVLEEPTEEAHHGTVGQGQPPQYAVGPTDEVVPVHRSPAGAFTYGPARHGPPPGFGYRPPARPAPLTQLPPDTPDFVGRRRELDRLLALAGHGPGPGRSNSPRVVTVLGGIGAGKSTLAVRAAHLLSARFPDGQLYARLHGEGDAPVNPALVLRSFLRDLQLDSGHSSAGGVDELARRFRHHTAGQAVLLLVEDAASAGQILPLLPGGSDSTVLVTSRVRLPGLPGASHLGLPPMTTEDGAALFASVLGPGRAAEDPAAVRQIVRLMGGLPLGVRAAAEKLAGRPMWSVADFALRLADGRRRRVELRTGAWDVLAHVASAGARLPRSAQQALALLSRSGPRSFALPDMAQLLGMPASAAEQILGSLMDHHAVELDSPHPPGVSGTVTTAAAFRIPELVRLAHAGEPGETVELTPYSGAATRTVFTTRPPVERPLPDPWPPLGRSR
ncbi:BTAD domain-containing putative transcriptional regulator [Streptomyces sp. NPDC006879]|uniref:AfsR/SARP family transcriptional regulator n=1 Tax=Streptomyces sp. NPDC006879 TaxID=3364767 RepID=UPI0036929E98